ncbi:hypothetical protein LIP_0361 [Limnochorda pilosa]|uniref:UGSC-like domain-containing protein n=2 Tax=Limnochorda pilosa TaxID=1555112 RepID=A0A0K2SGI5_LIMPI|nr:hypothetical protein [Limnochorda pilosa]BAS26218.1 hypothetical protein LIP_0361 [Limnochorda pilosa]
MKGQCWCIVICSLVVALVGAVSAGPIVAQEAQKWELVNPEGVAWVEPVKIAERVDSLEGKTVVLFWNGKHNGNNFLDRLAERLDAQVEGVRVLKSWEEPLNVPPGQNVAAQMIEAWQRVGIKPDLVIASQAD